MLPDKLKEKLREERNQTVKNMESLLSTEVHSKSGYVPREYMKKFRIVKWVPLNQISL